MTISNANNNHNWNDIQLHSHAPLSQEEGNDFLMAELLEVQTLIVRELPRMRSDQARAVADNIGSMLSDLGVQLPPRTQVQIIHHGNLAKMPLFIYHFVQLHKKLKSLPNSFFLNVDK